MSGTSSGEGAGSVAQLDGSPRRRLYRGRDPARAVTIQDLRAMAHRRLPDFALEYLEGGAGDELALAGNLAAFRRWRFVPRALVDVTARVTGATLFGARLTLPLVVAPTGLNGLFRHRADSLLAAAAAEAGIPFAQSTMSNDKVEEVAAAAPGLRHWFQLYVIDPPEITEHLIAAAERAGCEALVITTDAQSYGQRDWEEREHLERAWRGPRLVLDALSHPRWLLATLARHGMPRFGNLVDWLPRDRRGLFESADWIRARMDKGLSWEKVARIRDRWPRRLLLKGLLAPEDVVRAADSGADGAIVSNHGGRQLGASATPLDQLPAARAAIGKRLALLIDGGIRSGADIAKALALGADAVLVGRAPLYGVAAAGRAGAARALEILRDEFALTLALLGCPRADELTPDLLVRAAAPEPVAARD